jgi:hypothetical protein
MREERSSRIGSTRLAAGRVGSTVGLWRGQSSPPRQHKTEQARRVSVRWPVPFHARCRIRPGAALLRRSSCPPRHRRFVRVRGLAGLRPRGQRHSPCAAKVVRLVRQRPHRQPLRVALLRQAIDAVPSDIRDYVDAQGDPLGRWGGTRAWAGWHTQYAEDAERDRKSQACRKSTQRHQRRYRFACHPRVPVLVLLSAAR